MQVMDRWIEAADSAHETQVGFVRIRVENEAAGLGLAGGGVQIVPRGTISNGRAEAIRT